MRGGREGTDENSRFSIGYEAKSIYEGIAEDVGGTVGVDIEWFRWQEYYLEDNYENIVDDIYDVSSSTPGTGRRWMLPFKMPALMAQLIRSTNVMNERGFYVTDTLRLVLSAGDAMRMLPSLVGENPNQHIKDRILYRGQVFTPTRVVPRGHFGYKWAVVTVDCNEVNPEELVNDPQFQQYASKPLPELRLVANGFGQGAYSAGEYGN
jgi:hypothetical protein